VSRYVLSRLANIAVQVFVILSAVFVLFRIAPGDPAALILGGNAAQSQVDLLRRQMGLDEPLWRQYGDFLGRMLRGDFGESSSYSRSVVSVVLSHVGATLQLLAVSLAIAVTVGMAAGILAAVKPRAVFARGSLLLWVALLAIPNFWLGMLLVQVFAVNLRWLPATGGLLLPAVAVAARLVALVARLTRATMLEVLGEDFIRTAQARGVSPARLVFTHALRPALPHVLILIGLQAGYLLGGAVVVENLFSYPGMGQLLLAAVSQRDYQLMQGITVFFVAGFLILNLCVDLVSSAIDPRIRAAGAAA
jgi:peptide/nickel transport system permease protein